MSYNTFDEFIDTHAQDNEIWFDNISSNDPSLVKKAEDSVNDYTRTKMREEGFTRKILPALPITNDQLDRLLTTSKPVKFVDKEPNSPAAVSVPLADTPLSYYIRGNRYAVMFARIESPRAAVDIDSLRTYHMDIRTILSDNAIKDMLAEEDGRFVLATNVAAGNPTGQNTADGVVTATAGVKQHKFFATGGVGRENLVDMLKTMNRTPSRLEVQVSLTNHITIKDVMKFTYEEAGGDWSQQLLKSGWAETEFLGHRWLITIKTDLVRENRIYNYADPKHLGKHFELVPTTLFVHREAYMIDFFAYQLTGLTIGHTDAVTSHDFANG